jgi:hypothetical protein
LKSVVFIAAPLVLAAAGLVLAPKLADRSEFSAKGAARAGVEVTCSGGPLSACPVGSTLVFRFDDVSMPAFVQAYATPSPPNAGERVWYFPTSTVPSPQLTAIASSEVLKKGVVIGPEHAASAYAITVVLSSHPLKKDDLLRGRRSQALHRETIQLGVVR